MLFPLLGRIKREKVLDNFIRGQIYGYIKANPGDHYNSIKEKLELKNGTFAYHLRILEKEKFIKSRNDGLFRRFYPYDMNIPKLKQPEYVEIQLSHFQDSLVDLIRAKPGITQKELAKLAGASPQVVNYHVGVMGSFGIIKLEREGNKTQCFINRLHKIDARKLPPLDTN